MVDGECQNTIRTRVVVACLFCVGLVLATSAPLAAQVDPPIVIDDTSAVITIVEAESITAGGSSPGYTATWPYDCNWRELIYLLPIEIAGWTKAPVEGLTYELLCIPTDPSLAQIHLIVVYDPGDPVPGEAVTTSIDIRAIARQTVEPPALDVGLSPDGMQITGVETWLWPEGPTAEVSGSAVGDISGLTVWAEARWNRTEFNVDEPGVPTIVCSAVEPWSPDEEETGCSHTYLTESPARTVTAMSYWDFYWWDNAAQPTPVFWETVSLVETETVAVLDLEAVITAP